MLKLYHVFEFLSKTFYNMGTPSFGVKNHYVLQICLAQQLKLSTKFLY